MKRLKLVLVYLFVLFFASSFSFAQFSYQATILKISDGDTIWVLINGWPESKTSFAGYRYS